MGSEASETAWWPSLCDTSRTSVTKRAAGRPRRGALRGRHGNPGHARALAWNRVCGAIGFESSDARASMAASMAAC